MTYLKVNVITYLKKKYVCIFAAVWLQWTTACTLEVSCGFVQDNSRICFVHIILNAKAAFKEYVCKSVRPTVAESRPCYGLCFQDLFVNSLLHMILSCKRNLICTCMAFQFRNFSVYIQWLLSLVWTHSWGPISKEKEVSTRRNYETWLLNNEISFEKVLY